LNEQDVTKRYTLPVEDEAPVPVASEVDTTLELPEGMPTETFDLAPFSKEKQDGEREIPVSFAMTQFGFVYGPVLVTRRISDAKEGWVMLELAAARDVVHVKISKSGNCRIWQNGKEVTGKKKADANQQATYEAAVEALKKATTEAQAMEVAVAAS
jgi:hypothetical protein